MSIEHIQREIKGLRQELKSHRLYQELETIEAVSYTHLTLPTKA